MKPLKPIHQKNDAEQILMESLIKDIIETPQYQQLKNFRHHDQTIYDHNIRVTKLAYRLSRYFSVDTRSLIRGAMLHDFFFYDWRHHKGEGLHAFTHAEESFKNAMKHYQNINQIEKDIIIKHMWPLNIELPSFFETVLVTVSDKAVSTYEVMLMIRNKFKNQKKV